MPHFEPGGRYLILLEALAVTLTAQLFRYLLSDGIPPRERSVLTAFSIPIALFLVKAFFPGVNLSIAGILILYFGALLLEMLLPDRVRNGSWHNEKGKRFWKH